jgi:hypothetical protein
LAIGRWLFGWLRQLGWKEKKVIPAYGRDDFFVFVWPVETTGSQYEV